MTAVRKADKKQKVNAYEVAYLDYKAGMKYKDIAAKYNVSLSAVQSWQRHYWSKLDKECTLDAHDLEDVQENNAHDVQSEDAHAIEPEVVCHPTRGRPTLYNPDYANQACKLCMLRSAIRMRNSQNTLRLLLQL
jgi:hypothetical protein